MFCKPAYKCYYFDIGLNSVKKLQKSETIFELKGKRTFVTK